ncbi:MAG: MGDG synthase family glycosyltransferase, partial [Anaerolineales bacterium]
MMTPPTPTNQAHILFLFSDTGGGHRSAAEAIIEALNLEAGNQITTEMVDIFKEYAPKPLDRLPELYPIMVRIPQAWGFGYYVSNGHRRARLITASAWPMVRRNIRRLVRTHPSDLIVSVHPLANAPVLRALGAHRPPFITVVTDLVTTHALWYHRRTDLCIVPTEEARQRAFLCGLRKDQVEVIGLPVAQRFCQEKLDKKQTRQQLGWELDLPTILLVGGSEGMGPMEKVAHTIDALPVPLALIIVCGRNQKLFDTFSNQSWNHPVKIYGFVHQMAEFMQAADILVTKAGPGTITEALNAALPMLLYSRLPGQEDGNVSFVVSQGAGFWTPTSDSLTQALLTWLAKPLEYHKAVENCKRIARPNAARDIAR